MGEWKPQTLSDLIRYTMKHLPKATRSAVGALNRADDAQDVAIAAQQEAADAAAAALQAAGIAADKGTVYAQPNQPDPDPNGLWIDTDDGNKTYITTLVNGVATWVLTQDAGIQAAADAAAAALAAANAAQAAAAAAQSTANTANTNANAAQGTANDAKTAAATAQGAATAAQTAASGAQTTANGAAAAASTAQTAANTAKSAADAASSAASGAQGTANQAKTDAATAQSTAVAAATAAATAAAKALEIANGVLKNGGAEFDFDSWDATDKGSIAVQTSTVRTGAKAWVVTNNGEIRQGQFPVRPGDTWRFRWWAQASNTGSGTVNGGLRLQRSDQTATDKGWYDAGSSTSPVATTWTMQELTYTVPASGVTHIRARVAFANAAGITVYFDDIELVNITDAQAAAVAAANAASAAASAQTTANTAVTNAATAQGTANQAKTDAANAQTSANTAQSAATAAKTAADNAQSTANTAVTNAGTAQTAANQAQSTANTAVTNAGTAKTAADNAAAAAASAAGVAGSKADVLIQTSTPAAAFQKSTTLWIDTTNGGNTPKRWAGSAWIVVTDRAATDAATAAANAASAASAAQTTANTAVTNAATAQARADQAYQSAVAAGTAASNAQASANGKNTIRYRSAAPTTNAADNGTADGDLWFVIPNQQTGIVTGQYQWAAGSQSWSQQALSSAVLASIDAGKITTGTLTGVTITGVTITGTVITGGTLQTATTGKRVVINGTANTIAFYDQNGQNAGYMDGQANGASGGVIRIGGEGQSGVASSTYFGAWSLPVAGTAAGYTASFYIASAYVDQVVQAGTNSVIAEGTWCGTRTQAIGNGTGSAVGTFTKSATASSPSTNFMSMGADGFMTLGPGTYAILIVAALGAAATGRTFIELVGQAGDPGGLPRNGIMVGEDTGSCTGTLYTDGTRRFRVQAFQTSGAARNVNFALAVTKIG